MKQAIVAVLLFTVSFATFAEINRPRPGHHSGPGHYRPAPGHHHGPVMRPRPGHHRPGPVVIRPRPIPRPYPYPGPMSSCQVVMTDRFNRVFRRYYGHEPRTSMCPSALRACNYDIHRMGMWGYRCASVRW